MTIEEMHRQINLRTQKVNANAFDDFIKEEIDEYINLAISRFIKYRFMPESNFLNEGFEQSQKRYDDLRTLVVKNHELDPQNVSTNPAISGYFVDQASFPDNYNYLISLRCRINYNDEGISYSINSGSREADGSEGSDYDTLLVQANVVQSDDIYELLSDPFNKSSIEEPIADVSENGINIYTDDTFITEHIIINYLKQPTTVDYSSGTDSDLPIHTHDEIVDMAAELMLSDIGALGPEQQARSLQKVE